MEWTIRQELLRLPGIKILEQSKNGALDKLMTGYMNKLLSKSASEPSLHLLFLEVSHLLRSPLSLYHPTVIWRVMRGK
ncbi:MAG: hypothetical protein WBM86_30900 [Waterburya sp.]